MNEEKKNKRQERREKAKQKAQANRTRTMLIISVGAVLLVGAFIYNQAKPITDLVTVESNPRPNAERNTAGDPNAPIQIVEFSDFQCPFCDRFYTDTEPLLMEYFVKTGKVYFTYRSAGNWVSGNLGGVRTESQDCRRGCLLRSRPGQVLGNARLALRQQPRCGRSRLIYRSQAKSHR